MALTNQLVASSYLWYCIRRLGKQVALDLTCRHNPGLQCSMQALLSGRQYAVDSFFKCFDVMG
jgi:hypothetical protein